MEKGKKMFANHTSDKELITKTYRKAPTTIIKMQLKKWEKDLNTYFSKENKQKANRYMKRCLMSLVIRGMQIQTTIRYHLIPMRIAITKR